MAKKQSSVEQRVLPKVLTRAERQQIMRNFYMGEAARRAEREGKDFNSEEWIEKMMDRRLNSER